MKYFCLVFPSHYLIFVLLSNMKFSIHLITLNLFLVGQLFAQAADNVLLTINKEPVYTSEFLRVYEKNKDIVIDPQTKDIKEYLNLFVDFKLKLAEARSLGLDQKPDFKIELGNYKTQLADSYVKNEEIHEELVQETYERMKYEVNASHILVITEANASPSDTLKAYDKINEAYNKVKMGDSFEEVAKAYSEDPSVAKNSGNLSYFTVFDMVYEFENVAYSIPVGSISKPFRTQFGYHIVQVNDKRLARGELEVAHIFVKNNPDDKAYAKKQCQEIYDKIVQGEDFAYLAGKYSDDATSNQNAGRIPRFGSGQLIKPMEDQAFALKEPGDISRPFETEYGWHIFKLIKKYPLLPFDQLHDQIVQQLGNSNRSAILKKDLANKLAGSYKITQIDRQGLYDLEKIKSANQKELMVLSINEKSYSAEEFIKFRESGKEQQIVSDFEQFKAEKIIEYHKSQLENSNTEFALTLKEYAEGILLFDLLENNIWKKAESDSLGLSIYYKENIKNYYWKKSTHVIIANCNEKVKAEQVRELMLAGKNVEQIKASVNEGATIHVLFKEAVLELPSNKLPLNFEEQIGVSKVYTEDEKHFTVVHVLEIKPPKPKTLQENKGQVMNDYQNYLEQTWVKSLHQKYKVTFNEKEVKRVEKLILQQK